MIDSYAGSENRPESSMGVNRPALRLEAQVGGPVSGKVGCTELSHMSQLLSGAELQGQPEGEIRKDSENIPLWFQTV